MKYSKQDVRTTSENNKHMRISVYMYVCFVMSMDGSVVCLFLFMLPFVLSSSFLFFLSKVNTDLFWIRLKLIGIFSKPHNIVSHIRMSNRMINLIIINLTD